MESVVFAQELVDVGLLGPLQFVIAHGLVDATDLVVPQGFSLAVKEVDLSTQLNPVDIQIEALLSDVSFGVAKGDLLQDVVVGCAHHGPHLLGCVHRNLTAMASGQFGNLGRLGQTCGSDVRLPFAVGVPANQVHKRLGQIEFVCDLHTCPSVFMGLLTLLLFAHASFRKTNGNCLLRVGDLLSRATFQFALFEFPHDGSNFLLSFSFLLHVYAAFSSWLFLFACGVLMPKSLQMYRMWKHSLRN